MVYPAQAREHLRVQQALSAAALRAVALQWARMGPDFDTGWSRIAGDVHTLVASAQVGAARVGARYVPRILDQVSSSVPEADAQVRPQTFAGYAADGRALETLLDGAPIRAKLAVAGGATARQALVVGGRWLADTVGSELADAGRGGAAVAITSRPATGWVRQVTPPCCPHCAILAGRWYRYSQGFQRHKRCDCRHIPAPEAVAGDLTLNPQELYSRGLVKGLTDGQRDAINNGADLNQVVNSARTMRTTVIGGRKVSTTLEGTTVRGLAQRRLAQSQGVTRDPRGGRYARAVRPRLTPDAIAEVATDRADAVRLLAANGYLA